MVPCRRRPLSAFPGSDRFVDRVPRDPVDEPRQHQSVERCDRVPLGAAEESPWVEAGGLHQKCSTGDWFDCPLQPCVVGQAR